jgi:phosphoglycolate phosphatase
MNLSSLKLWIFDLDGTLLDSRLDLVHGVNATLEHFKLPRLPEKTVLSFVGDGAEDLVYRSLTAAGVPSPFARAQLAETLAWFLDYYGDHCLDYTTLYPGALELLDRLDARLGPGNLAVLTNKPEKPALKILAHLGLLERFAYVVPGDGPLGKKPDPTGMAYILNQMNVSPSDAVLVGDSLQDLRTARAAGSPFLAFLGGLTEAGLLSDAAPDLAVNHLSEITRFLDAAGADPKPA